MEDTEINQTQEETTTMTTILVAEYGSEIHNTDELREYCENNVSENTLYDYVESECGYYVDIGACSFETREVIRNCGDIWDYASDYIDSEFEYLEWSDIEACENEDAYTICGLDFTVKKIVAETPEQKAERERKETEEALRALKGCYENEIKTFVLRMTNEFPNLASLETMIPIICEAFAEERAKKDLVEKNEGVGSDL